MKTSMMLGNLFVAATAATAIVSTVSAPAQAAALASVFSTPGGFSFAKNTTIRLDFIASHGAYQSSFGVFAGKADPTPTFLFEEIMPRNPGSNNANDSLGTCGVAVAAPCSRRFTFQAGQTYLLGLRNTSTPAGTVLSDDNITDASRPGMRFVDGPGAPLYPTQFAPPTGANFVPLPIDGNTTAIFVNDSWKGDRDANDFILTAKPVPEPTTLAGLGVVIGGFAMARRRKSQKAKSVI